MSCGGTGRVTDYDTDITFAHTPRRSLGQGVREAIRTMLVWSITIGAISFVLRYLI